MLVYDQYIYPEKPDIDDDIVVFHSGFCSTSPNYSYGKDTRDYYLIHFVTRGKGTYRVGQRIFHLSANDGFLITPGTTIVHTADKKEPWDLCWVAFFGRRAAALLEKAGLDEEHLIFHYDKDDFLENCIKNIYNESRTGKNIASITGYFYLFAGRLIELHEEKEKKEPDIVSFSRFDDAVIYIRRNIRSRITIENLANYMRLDTSQVYRIFKKNTGMSPQCFITACGWIRPVKCWKKQIFP